MSSKEYWQEYAKKHAGKIQAYKREYYQNNKERIIETHRNYSQTEQGRDAHRKAQAKYRAKLGERGRRQAKLRQRYGIDSELVASSCQVCESTKAISVDHDHITGQVRGFLCRKCNTALGMANDNPELLRKLASYLEDQN